MSVTWLKSKYAVGAGYKIQKSQHGNSGGGKNKKSNKRVKKNKDLVGKKLLLVNMSGKDYFCPVTGKKLPSHGMVVEYKGVYYANYEASARANS